MRTVRTVRAGAVILVAAAIGSLLASCTASAATTSAPTSAKIAAVTPTPTPTPAPPAGPAVYITLEAADTTVKVHGVLPVTVHLLNTTGRPVMVLDPCVPSFDFGLVKKGGPAFQPAWPLPACPVGELPPGETTKSWTIYAGTTSPGTYTTSGVSSGSLQAHFVFGPPVVIHVTS